MKSLHIYNFFLLIAIAALASCGSKEETPAPSVPLDVEFTVPQTAYICPEKDNTFTFEVLSSKSPALTDLVLFKKEGETAHKCPIVETSGESFTITLFQGIEAASYDIYINRDTQLKKKGTMKVVLTDGVSPAKDANVYGRITCDGKGVPDVVVSDGFEVVKTDGEGVYQMTSQKKLKYVFMSVPSGYEPECDGVLPVNSVRLTSDVSVPERADFVLYDAGDQTNHTMLVLGDIHLANRCNDKEQFAKFTSDINEYIAAHKNEKIYALTLGDMTWDRYWYTNSYQFEQYLGDVNAIKGLGIYHLIGNHDHDMKSAGDFDTMLRFCDVIAPDYYSFNVGKVHYIMLDNIVCTNDGSGTPESRTYKCALTQDELDWMRKDLEYVPADMMVMVAMHGATYSLNAESKQALRDVFAGRYFHAVTGHSHIVSEQRYEEFIDHNCGAVCACWWQTWYNTKAIHIGTDGAPGGYMVFDMAGNDTKWQFKPTGGSEQLQFRTYDRNCINLSSNLWIPDAPQANKDAFDKRAGIWASENKDNEVYINIWNYGGGWSIEVNEVSGDGSRTPLAVENVNSVAYDPLHLFSYTMQAMAKNVNASFLTGTSHHMWKVTASSPDSTLEIKVTDIFGRVYTETMTRPKPFDFQTYKQW
ncbi:MAG: calcineurin-like phosphoesterase C-terminal domain-containing protein [Candidatus Cryptobacteroides sp.]